MVNRALNAARSVFRAINARDLGCLEDAVTDDFVDHGSPFPLPPGPEGYRQILTYVSQVLQIRYDVLDEIVTDDRVVFRALAHGVAVDAIHGPGTAGKTFDMPTLHVYRTEGDRLAEHWGVRDELGVLKQLGVLEESTTRT
jgi:predicted ester cyclase